MQVCRYSKMNKCVECDAPFHTKCIKFQKAHVSFLGQELLPFKFKKIEPQRGVLWSRDINNAKSVALSIAVSRNAKVKKLNFNQVISLCLSNDEFEATVLYLECLTKMSGDVEKVTNVVKSFIDKMTLTGTKVIIYVAPSVTFNFQEYTKI